MHRFCTLLVFLLAGSTYGHEVDFKEVYQKVKNSVVTIEVGMTDENARLGIMEFGSGVVIDNEGYIISNKHVVNKFAREIWVFVGDNTKAKGRFINQLPDTDISLIKIDSQLTKIVPAILGDSNNVEPGDLVLVIGSPVGLRGTVTHGIVSSIRGSPRVTGRLLSHTFIQTDAAINPGNSGGAMVNMAGEVIGIPTMIFTGGVRNDSGGVAYLQNLGFAIPINIVKDTLPRLRSDRVTQVGWIGVKVQKVNPDISRITETNEGLVVTVVDPQSPAADKLKQLDIIVAVDGQKVSEPENFEWMIKMKMPESTLMLEVIKRGSKQKVHIEVTVGTLNR